MSINDSFPGLSNLASDHSSSGENLIFLISQPRAGSTMLQRILATHPEIHTLSEPWLMLHPLYPLVEAEEYRADYDPTPALARKATREFIANLNCGEEEYLYAVRHTYGLLYHKVLANTAKRYFLDKTPRYYLVVPALHRTFPAAHYIILMRNPLAVLCSIVNTWVTGRWSRLKQYRLDLIKAPFLLVRATTFLATQGLRVSYEKLLSNPEWEVKRICQWIGIQFNPKMVEYGEARLPQWSLGDQGEVYQHSAPAPDKGDRWLEVLKDAQTWRVANDYLHFLGEDTVSQMGYSYDELQSLLISHRPNSIRLRFTTSLEKLLHIRAKAESRAAPREDAIHRDRTGNM
ncbi:MAG TPA: sulfotransferase [Candidatus Eisenbacteria bacterium]|nr:sulfotransferase [Candidatus Eisenbacteria bacterium]